MAKPKTAIIGTGISGLGAAYILNPYHDITVFEKNDYIGGHSRTIDVDINTVKKPVDTGFIVFNKRNYPHLVALFDSLDVAYEKSDMSFGVNINQDWLAYSSSNLFAQKKNLLRPQFWGMVRDILRFNRCAENYLDRGVDYSLGQCLDDLSVGQWFRDYYIKPMGAAIWSCSTETILNFPASSFIRFFKNHGLLTVFDQPQWYTVSGGSREYIKKLTARFADRIHLHTPVQKVEKQGDQWLVNDEVYDHVVFACHADDALRILNAPRPVQNVLQNFAYQTNYVVVHSDESFMPTNKNAWASWMYLSDYNESVSLTYWMNNLQNLKTPKPLLITLNPDREPKSVYDMHEFKHPVFNQDAVKAQDDVDTIQGHENLWFCGAYQRYGFHEDGLKSAVDMASKMGVKAPWT